MPLSSIFAYVFLGLSYATLVCALVLLFRRYRWDSDWRNIRGFVFFGLIMGAILLMMIGYVIGSGDPVEVAIVKCVSGTFQYFSLDADYVSLIENAQLVFAGWGVWLYNVAAIFFVFAAPLAGGAALFNLLASVAPRFRLFINNKRTFYVFSELNERSIAIAEDIAQLSWKLKGRNRPDPSSFGIDPEEGEWLKSACVLFTDAYSDEGEETDSELLSRAKRLGAICLKDDVTERPLRRLFGGRTKIVYFLIDDRVEENNLSTALSLLSEDRKGMWCPAKPSEKRGVRSMEMFVFTQSEVAAELIDSVPLTEERKHIRIRIKVVNEFRNIVYRMFDDGDLVKSLITGTPSGSESALYRVWREYFSQPPEKRSIGLAVLGGGRIARELIGTSLWCWQMLSPEGGGKRGYASPKIKIDVFAQNAEELGSELEFHAGEALKLYADASFHRTDFPSAAFGALFEQSGALNAQQIVIALGDDERNMEAARWAERYIRRERKTHAPVIIRFAIENNALFTVLEARASAQDDWCIVRPFNTMRECFTYANIRTDDLERRALQVERAHEERWLADFTSAYNRDSSVALALHMTYKLLCLGSAGKEGDGDLLQKIMGTNAIRDCENRLYWLEHRRWCAYMRVSGYKCPTAKQFAEYAFGRDEAGNFFYNGADKRKDLRLHACLLEGDADYRSVGQILLAYANARYAGDAEKLAKIGELAAKIGGSGEAKACVQIRALMADAVGEIGAEIGALLASDGTISLRDWMIGIFKGYGEETLDDLDRLSLLVTLTAGEKTPRPYYNFKRYDLMLVRALYLDILKMRLENAFRTDAAGGETDEAALALAVGELYEALGYADLADAPERVTVTYGEKADLMLIRTKGEYSGSGLTVMQKDGIRYILVQEKKPPVAA